MHVAHLRYVVTSASCSQLLFKSACNNNDGSILRTVSHKHWSSHIGWDGNLYNAYKELNWYATHCYSVCCRQKVLYLNSSCIKSSSSSCTVCESAVVLIGRIIASRLVIIGLFRLTQNVRTGAIHCIA